MNRALLASVLLAAPTPLLGQVLTTTHAGGDQAWGVMFDIEPLIPDVRIPRINLDLAFGVTGVSYSVWTRPGTYAGHTDSADGWTRVATGSGFVFLNNLLWPQGQVTGVFIEITAASATPLPTTPIPPALPVYENGDLRLMGGVAKAQGGFGGATIADRMINATLRVTACYANCEATSTTGPALNVNDFICFQNAYVTGQPYANCDGSTLEPILNVADFMCVLNRYSQGCQRP
jgi:hypothetical protein